VLYGKNLSQSEKLDSLVLNLDKFLGSDVNEYEKYQDDPVGFCEQELGETLTPDIEKLMRSVRDNQVTIARSGNATGKSFASARIAYWFYKSFPESKVYTAAAPPITNLQDILWGELNSIAYNNQEIFKSDNITNLLIKPMTDDTTKGEPPHLIRGLAIPMAGTSHERVSKFSGKHAPQLLFLLDEGDAIPDEVYEGIETCMSGGMVRLLVMFNPKHESGAAYRFERDQRANVVHLSAFNHPNVITGRDEIPGAVDRETTVRRINEWSRPRAKDESISQEFFEVPEFLVGTTAKDKKGYTFPPLSPGFRRIDDPALSYMVLGEYPAQAATQLISREWINKARSRWDSYVAEYGEVPPEGTKAIMGLDVAEFGTDANVACFRYGGYIERLTSWSGIDIIETGDRAIKEYRSRNVMRANVDATGVGAGVAPYMNRSKCYAIGIKVASKPTEETELGEFYTLNDQLGWSVREWLRTDPGAMLPPDNMLIEELLTPTYEVDNGKIKLMKKQHSGDPYKGGNQHTMRSLLKRSPDRWDSLKYTFYSSNLLFPGM